MVKKLNDLPPELLIGISKFLPIKEPTRYTHKQSSWTPGNERYIGMTSKNNPVLVNKLDIPKYKRERGKSNEAKMFEAVHGRSK